MCHKTCGECKNFADCSWVTPEVIADNCEDFEQRDDGAFCSIAQAPEVLEVLEEEMVYRELVMEEDGRYIYYWYSTILPGYFWYSEEEAVNATVAKLKELAVVSISEPVQEERKAQCDG